MCPECTGKISSKSIDVCISPYRPKDHSQFSMNFNRKSGILISKNDLSSFYSACFGFGSAAMSTPFNFAYSSLLNIHLQKTKTNWGPHFDTNSDRKLYFRLVEPHNFTLLNVLLFCYFVIANIKHTLDCFLGLTVKCSSQKPILAHFSIKCDRKCMLVTT